MIKNRSHPCNWTYVRVQHSIVWRIRELAQCKLSTVKILYQLNTVDVCLHCFKILTHWTIVMMIMKQIIKSQSCLSFVRFQLWVSCWIFVNRKYYKLGQCYVNTPKSFTFFFTFYRANLLKTGHDSILFPCKCGRNILWNAIFHLYAHQIYLFPSVFKATQS